MCSRQRKEEDEKMKRIESTCHPLTKVLADSKPFAGCVYVSQINWMEQIDFQGVDNFSPTHRLDIYNRTQWRPALFRQLLERCTVFLFDLELWFFVLFFSFAVFFLFFCSCFVFFLLIRFFFPLLLPFCIPAVPAQNDMSIKFYIASPLPCIFFCVCSVRF